MLQAINKQNQKAEKDTPCESLVAGIGSQSQQPLCELDVCTSAAIKETPPGCCRPSIFPNLNGIQGKGQQQLFFGRRPSPTPVQHDLMMFHVLIGTHLAPSVPLSRFFLRSKHQTNEQNNLKFRVY